MKKLKLAALLFLISIIAAQAQTKITTYSAILDTIRGLNGKDIHLVDTLVFTNGTRIWKAPHFGETIVAGNILFGGTHDARYGGVMRNNTLLNFDSTNKRLGIGLVLASTSANLHVRGTSAVSGSVFRLQNSTPTTLFDVLNTGAGTISNPSGVVASWEADASPTFTLGEAGVTTAQLFINGGSSSSSLISGLTSSGTYAFYTNASGAGYWGTPIAAGGLTTNHGLKFAPPATGSASVAAVVNGVFVNPAISAGANDQVLSAFSVQPSSFSLGGTTGTTSQIVDFKSASGTSRFKISDAGIITLGGGMTSTNSITASQFIHSVDSTNSATVNMTTQSIQKVIAGSSVTTVNFPPGVQGLVVTIMNRKAGTITVTVHEDLTGAFSVTQAAQSSVQYVYSSGAWQKMN